TLPAGALLGLEARVDSALLWALVRQRLEAGQPAAAALAGTVAAVRAAGLDGRFNFLLTDGRVIAATAAGDTLFWRRRDGAVVVASEPGDDEPVGRGARRLRAHRDGPAGRRDRAGRSRPAGREIAERKDLAPLTSSTRLKTGDSRRGSRRAASS